MLGIIAGMNQKDFFAFLFRQWHVPGWYFWRTLAVCFLRFWLARDARHHDRYGPEGFPRVFYSGSGMCQAGISGARLRYVSCVFGWLVMLGITAGMDQKEGYVVLCRKLRKIRSCSSSTRSSSSSLWCEADSYGLRSMSLLLWMCRFPVSGSHLYVIWCSPVEYRIMDFLGDPRIVPYSALLGSTVDTCLASVYEAFW